MDKQSYHFIGIGGIGMSALAHILIDRGVPVSGSDLSSSYLVETLKRKGGRIEIGHTAANIENTATVVYSTDVPLHNPEYEAALRKGVRLLHRSALLAELMCGYKSLLVAGTHGKTTTSSLLAHLLASAGLDPSYAIGGIVNSFGSNGGSGRGHFFVAEADESDGSFLKYLPWGAILTNIDNDHLSYWQNEAELLKGFQRFIEQVQSAEHFFWCQDDERLALLRLPGNSYGFSEKADLSIQNYQQKGWKNQFDFTFKERSYQEVEVPLIGAHNVLNAAAVFGVALQIGIPEEQIRTGLKSFKGVGRRAEEKGESNGVVIYDDYAHHPTEIVATLRAIKMAIGKRRLIVAFQPHRYTRTADCMDQYPEAFHSADLLILTDIYSAREEPIFGVTSEALLKKVQERSPVEVRYAARDKLEDYLTTVLKPTDVLVTMGAGDITKVGPELLKRL